VSGAAALQAIALADFRERVRRHGFLVTIGLAVYAAYAFLPPNHAVYATLQFDGRRGIYNSAWVGTSTALLTTTFLSLVGFYVVKSAVDRDRGLGVGAILAATPLRKSTYVLGKALSNFAVLTAMVAVVATGAGVVQVLRGEDPRIHLGALLLPFALLTLPAMAIVAAAAVLFETMPGLAGGLGNVVYFVLWIAMLSTSAARQGRGFDLGGFGWVLPSMAAACHRAYPDYDLAHMPMSLGVNVRSGGVWNLATFVWEGPRWDAAALASRFLCLGVAIGAVGVSTVVFDRFDEAPLPRRTSRSRRDRSSPTPRAASRVAVPGLEEPDARGARSRGAAAAAATRLTPLTTALDFGWAPLVMAELRLVLRDAPRPWWLVAAGLSLAGWLAPLWAARQGVLAALWIWPLLLWSALGNREARHGTEALVLSAPRPVLRPVLAQWLAGTVLALGLASGVVLRLAAAGSWSAAFQVAAGGMFIPALAVGLGAMSGSGKLFEVIYLLLWYAGPISHARSLDFTGATGSDRASGWGWLVAAAVALSAALMARGARANR
jgi:hypothetical protein